MWTWNIPGFSRIPHTNTGLLVEEKIPTSTCHFLSHLGQSRPLDEVIEFPQSSVSRKTLNVPEEILRLSLEQTSEDE